MKVAYQTYDCLYLSHEETPVGLHINFERTNVVTHYGEVVGAVIEDLPDDFGTIKQVPHLVIANEEGKFVTIPTEDCRVADDYLTNKEK